MALHQQVLLVDHINAIREIPGFEGCTIGLIVESNLGNEAEYQDLACRLAHLERIVVMNEDTSHERLGIRTTATLKRSMAFMTGLLLMHGKIKFHRHLFSVNGRQSALQLRQQLLGQFLNYKRIVKPAQDEWDTSKETFTGKKGGNKDDILIALQLGIYMKEVAYAKPEKYQRLISCAA